MVSTAQLCIYCKGGKNLCGLNRCPLLDNIKMKEKLKQIPSDNFFGPSPSIFVGRIGYPKVFVGPLSNIGDSGLSEEPSSWFGKSYDEIIEKRSLVLRSKYKQDIYSKTRFVEENQLLALAKKPTDVELKFKDKPVYRMSFSDMIQPMGPSVSLKKMRITENVKISRSVDKIVSDELKANDASFLLYKSGEDVYKITTILSSGILGLDKKMVPTRWSITAIDDLIAKNLMKSIRTFPSINEFRVYYSKFLNNKFIVLMMPGNWEFENFEAWAPGSFWSFNLKKTELVEEYEPFKGRSNYADKQTGGYYASRLGVVEELFKMKRQARVVVFREVYEGYVVPLGVFVVRETVRNALKNKPIKFDNKENALKYINPKLRLPLEEYMKESKILKQKRLGDFIKI